MEFVKEGHLGGYVKQDDNFPHGDPMTYLPALWRHMVEMHQIHSILDIGSGQGHATKAFTELGVDALGLDGCQEAIDTAVAKIEKHDFCNGPYLCDPVDAIWSCEFLEHIEEKYLDNVLETLQLATKCIYLTAAMPGQGGHHHVNCQPPEYWIERIEPLGFKFDQALTNLGKAFSQMDRNPNWFMLNGLAFKMVNK